MITEIIDATGDGAGNTLNGPFGIAVDGSGNVYVTGDFSDNAFKITPGGVITEIIDGTGDGAGNTLRSARNIAVDGSGNVYVAGLSSDNAFKITPGGVITEIIDATGDGAGNTLNGPFGIAVDGSGNVYVSGVFSDNAFKITIFPFMTIWAVNDHTDGKLQYYTLDMASSFLNIEGDIEGITGDKDLEDLIIDSSPTPEDPLPNDGKFYIVNNVGTSTIYSLDFSEFDNSPATSVTATLVGSTGLPTNPNTYSPEEISSLLVHNGTLYGLSLGVKKLYTISTDVGTGGMVTEVATLNVQGTFRSDAMTFRPGNNNGMTFGPGTGTVYLLKTNTSGGESEIWKFTSFPGPDITYVRQIETSGKVEALTAHPDGFLYASDETTLYQISVDSSFIAYLADYTVDIEGMDFFYDIELIIPAVPTRQFIPIAPTPVELVSFTAEAKSGKVILNWQTATEVNNYGFDIERQVGSMQSTVGNWQKVGFVDGHGNSNSPKTYSFADINPAGGSKFSYRLKQIDNDGTYEYSDIVEVEFVPTEFALYQNYPNPFNPSTKIKYSIPQESIVTIKVFDILGEEVATLLNEKQEAGTYDVDFDGRNLGSGIYLYKMEAETFSQIKKMLIIK